MKNNVKRKLHISYGFTLAETLLAVLILLMVTTIVAAGIPSARGAYEKVVLTSNAEVLLSTTIATLRNELGTAMDVKVDESGTFITYYNTARGATSKISLGKVLESSPEDEKTIVLYRYSGAYVPPDAVVAEKIAMSSSTSSDRDLYVKYTKVTYVDGVITFSGLSVDQVSGIKNLAGLDRLSIRLITE